LGTIHPTVSPSLLCSVKECVSGFDGFVDMLVLIVNGNAK
jgi:hypothetical protein